MKKLLLLICLLCYQSVFAENIVTSVEQAVVRVINFISEDDGATGTGFIINSNNYVVTNHHVIENYTTLLIADGGVGREHLKQANIVWSSVERDLAILHVPNLTPRRPLKLNSSELEKASVVLALGFPGAADELGDELDFVETSATDGRVSRLMRNTSWDNTSRLFDIIQHSAQINGGNSGGPLINLCGEVVGVNTAGVPSAQGIFYASHINSLIEVLTAENIDFQVTTATCTTKSGFDIQYLIVLIVLILLTIIVLIFLSIAFRQPRQQAVKAVTTYTQWLPKNIFYAKSTDLWILQGINGHKHIYLPINQEKLKSSQGVTIGRSAKLCDLTIQDDTISRRHARLSYVDQQLLLEDLDSANGTLVNGQKIKAYHTVLIDENSHIQLGNIVLQLIKVS
jgi:hypothetical protein